MMRGVPSMPPDAPHLTLYGRKGCHLCDVARLQLRALQQTFPFHLDDVSIDGDPELERRYLLEIPVVEVGGTVVAQGAVDIGVVRAALINARLGTLGQYPPADEGPAGRARAD
ncbi:MAG: glutaredoxin family protein [Dehalococcoidia bacterium]